ncbi:ComF family protein [Halodesulfovibrio aestuarii]|uniref:ComF family protein n=1 Tax=Halodesulfovibrio aestuarii TaxID=126333 RepID=A0A8G2C9F4_9BACT|nr:ComF family protein [Halodesulfovibrio aestuarii]SHJ08608.1 comF family protein [Halodesulfovibrio aestuarii]
MHSVFALLKSTAAFLGLDETRCVSCFAPYSPLTDISFRSLYEEQLTTPEKTEYSERLHHQWSLSLQLCPDCLRQLAPRTQGYCPSCGMLYAKASGTPSRCSSCMITPPPWTHITLYGAYEGILRELLLKHKFHNRLDAGLTLARLLATKYYPLAITPAAVVPIPLHSSRLLHRGHNQSMLSAKLLAQKINAHLMPELLQRNRETTPQATLSKKERNRNLSGAFTATIPSALKNTHILLVDDIATTGSTLRQAAKALLSGGAGSVEVAIMARTPEPENVIR